MTDILTYLNQSRQEHIAYFVRTISCFSVIYGNAGRPAILLLDYMSFIYSNIIVDIYHRRKTGAKKNIECRKRSNVHLPFISEIKSWRKASQKPFSKSVHGGDFYFHIIIKQHVLKKWDFPYFMSLRLGVKYWLGFYVVNFLRITILMTHTIIIW